MFLIYIYTYCLYYIILHSNILDITDFSWSESRSGHFLSMRLADFVVFHCAEGVYGWGECWRFSDGIVRLLKIGMMLETLKENSFTGYQNSICLHITANFGGTWTNCIATQNEHFSRFWILGSSTLWKPSQKRCHFRILESSTFYLQHFIVTCDLSDLSVALPSGLLKDGRKIQPNLACSGTFLPQNCSQRGSLFSGDFVVQTRTIYEACVVAWQHLMHLRPRTSGTSGTGWVHVASSDVVMS